MSADDPGGDGARASSWRPGQAPVLLAALGIGLVLMGLQLWLLTVALDLYLGGEGARVWQLAVVSGLVFLGGVAMLALLRGRGRWRRWSG